MSDLVVPVQKNIDELASYDPTKSKTLRTKYSSQFHNRWKPVRGACRESIVENDAFRLKSGIFEGQRAQSSQSFQEQGKSKAKAFEEWFRQQARRTFELAQQQSPQEFPPQGRQPQQQQPPTQPPEQPSNVPEWIAVFALAAYIKGMEMANDALPSPYIPSVEIRSTILNQQPYLDRYVDMARKQRDEISGLIERVTNIVRRKVVDGLQSERNRRFIADTVNERIRKVGVTDGRRTAETETIRTINDAALTLYKEAGVEEVTPQVEYNTRQDDRVCEICRPKHGQVYTIEEAYGVIPQHPECRCYFIPSN